MCQLVLGTRLWQFTPGTQSVVREPRLEEEEEEKRFGPGNEAMAAYTRDSISSQKALAAHTGDIGSDSR